IQPQICAKSVASSGMASFYPCDKPRLLEDLQQLKPTKGFCILIDMVGSVALKDRGLYEWSAAICNVISKSRKWLSGLGDGEEAEETDGRLLQQWGLLPLKIVGDCIMFYISLRRPCQRTLRS